MRRVSSILGRGPHWRVLPTFLRPSCHPHREYDLHFEHPATSKALHPHDIYVGFRMIVDIMDPKEARRPSINETSHTAEKEDPMIFETTIKVLCIARIQQCHRLSCL